MLTLYKHFKVVKEVNRYWKNSGVLNGLLKLTAYDMNQKYVALQLLEKTRWQGKLYTTQSNTANIKLMQRAILNKQACLGKKLDANAREKYRKIRVVILNKQYWKKTRQLKDLLRPFL